MCPARASARRSGQSTLDFYQRNYVRRVDFSGSGISNRRHYTMEQLISRAQAAAPKKSVSRLYSSQRRFLRPDSGPLIEGGRAFTLKFGLQYKWASGKDRQKN